MTSLARLVSPVPTADEGRDGGEWDNEKEERTERNELLRQIYCVVPPSLRPSVPPSVPPSLGTDRMGCSKSVCWEMWREGRKEDDVYLVCIHCAAAVTYYVCIRTPPPSPYMNISRDDNVTK